MAFTKNLNVNTCKEILIQVCDRTYLKAIYSLLICCYSWLFPSFEILAAVYILILIDTITGFAAALKNKNIKSSEFFRVAVKCIVYFLFIITGRVVDKVAPIQFAATIIETFLVITEAISIIENLGKLGYEAPDKLVKLLRMFGDIELKKK